MPTNRLLMRVPLILAALTIVTGQCLAAAPPAERRYFNGMRFLEDGREGLAIEYLEKVARAPEVDLGTGKYKDIAFRKELVQLLVNEGVTGLDPSFNIANFGEALRARAHTRLGEIHMARGDYDRALSELKRATLSDPEYPMGHCRTAQVLLAKGDLTAAIKAAKQAYLLSPTYGEYRRTYATAVAKEATGLYEKGQTGLARMAYEFAFQIDPLNPEAMAEYGWLLYVGKEQRVTADDPGARAIREYTKFKGVYLIEQATQMAPSNPRYHLMLGRVYDREAQWKLSLASYKRALETANGSLEAALGAARAFNGLGAFESAIAMVRQAARAENDAEAYVELAAAYRGNEQYGAAVASAQDAINADERSARAHYECGLALRCQGRTEGALAAFRRAEQLDPKGEIGLKSRVQMLQLKSIKRVRSR
ncbi:MAG: tetratricopeptide repeat protein [Armatimonadota bacterium]